MTRGPRGTRFGFPPEARLRKRRDFLAVQRVARRLFTRHFIVFAHPGATSEYRVGITASKRVGNSVVRNRWKRIIRECFRHLRPELRGPGPRDIVIIARAGNEPPSLDVALRELRGVLGGGRRRRRARP